MDRLHIFIGDKKIGEIYDTSPLSFSYSEDCLCGDITPSCLDMIPLQKGVISGLHVESFFENLLPEGVQRDSLSARFHVTSIFGLLKFSGSDVAGDLIVINDEYHISNEVMRTSWGDIASMLSGNSIAIKNKMMNSNLSGAQTKYSLVMKDGEPYFPISPSASTHILKPNILMQGSKVWNSSFNEAFVMRLAKECGLNVATATYIKEAESCLIERFDRKVVDGCIVRIHQSDICQFEKVKSDRKYECDGGPSFEDCFSIVRDQSSMPVIDCKSLLNWLFFNLCIGNNDSHAKNVSMYKPDSGDWRLTPFYDLMCTRVYSGLSTNFAFKIGDHYNPSEITNEDMDQLFRSINFDSISAFKMISLMCEKIENNLAIVANAMISTGMHNESRLAGRMISRIQSNIGRLRNQVLMHSEKQGASPIPR